MNATNSDSVTTYVFPSLDVNDYNAVRRTLAIDLSDGNITMNRALSLINGAFYFDKGKEYTKTNLLLDWYLYERERFRMPDIYTKIGGSDL